MRSLAMILGGTSLMLLVNGRDAITDDEGVAIDASECAANTHMVALPSQPEAHCWTNPLELTSNNNNNNNHNGHQGGVNNNGLDDDNNDGDNDEYDVDGFDFDDLVKDYTGGVELHPNFFGKPQVILLDLFTKDDRAKSMALMEAMNVYMTDLVTTKFDDDNDDEEEKIRQSHFRSQIQHYCRNDNRLCIFRAGMGHCEEDEFRNYMIEFCSPACRTCVEYWKEHVISSDLVDANEEEDEEDADDGDYDIDVVEEDKYFGKPAELVEGDQMLIEFGVPQYLGTEQPEEVKNLVGETHRYMTNIVFVEHEYQGVVDYCQNRFGGCSYWALHGNCMDEEYKSFMELNCAPACKTCLKLDFTKRCPIPWDTPMTWEEGGLHAFFENITASAEETSNPTNGMPHVFGPIRTMARPSPDTDQDKPWVVTIENFLSDAECKRLIQVGHEEGFERSREVGEESAIFGWAEGRVDSGRSSTNTWCPDECYDDPILRPVFDRIEHFTRMPYENMEWLQLLRYKPGQHYHLHHDYIVHEARRRPQGPRILTTFLYLNDVEDGGETAFPSLNITVKPKKGMALLWPNVLNDSPLDMDERTFHEALPVNRGFKYGATFWAHQRNFKNTFEAGCA